MKKNKLNIKIAKALGFEKHPYCVNDEVVGHQWCYPKDWAFAQYQSPVFNVPDFVSLMQERAEQIKQHTLIPSDYET